MGGITWLWEATRLPHPPAILKPSQIQVKSNLGPTSVAPGLQPGKANPQPQQNLVLTLVKPGINISKTWP